MILVTLGTQKQQFTRLLDAIENSNIDDEIIVQAGHTKYESKKMKIFDFISYDKMEELVNKADIIITHGGTGSIVEPLKKAKRVIACARLKKYGEHVDDHQRELVSIFSEQGYIVELKDGENLEDAIEKVNDITPKVYQSNTDNFIKKLEEEIEKPVKKNRTCFVISLILLVTFYLINLFAPIGGDDWTGKNIGTNNLIEIGKMAIERYKIQEGRVVSRFFVVFFQNTEWLWNIFGAMMIATMYYLICKISGAINKKVIPFVVALSIIFLKSTIFTQSYLWIAGNCTYTVPLFFILIYFMIMNKIWKDDFKLSKFKVIACVILNILASMMAEGTSAALVFANLLLLVYSYFKNKKIDKNILMFFLISIGGFLVMMLSPGVRNRLHTDSSDFERLSVIQKCIKNLPNLVKNTFIENNVLLVVLTLALFFTIIKYRKEIYVKVLSIIFFIIPAFTVFINIISIMASKSSKVRFILKYMDWVVNPENIFIQIYWLLFTILAIYVVFKFVKEKYKALFFMFVGLSNNLALLLSPISGDRTALFTVYMLYIFAFILLNEIEAKEKLVKVGKVAAKIVFTFSICLLLVIYFNVYRMQIDREKVIKESVQKNPSEVTVLLFPEKILHNLNTWNEFHQIEFKRYYDLDKDIKIKRVKTKWWNSIIYLGYNLEG